MLKKENEYAHVLSTIANDLNLKNSTKKALESKDTFMKQIKGDEEITFKSHIKKMKNEQIESHTENLNEKLQNLQYKFQKLEEFTDQKSVDSFCRKFKNNAQKVTIF
jgi:hypothetical protein